jgi:hypothetical protein
MGHKADNHPAITKGDSHPISGVILCRKRTTQFPEMGSLSPPAEPTLYCLRITPISLSMTNSVPVPDRKRLLFTLPAWRNP